MTDTPTPVVLHLSITPEGGWHSHATALADLLTEQGDERHLLMHWPGATTGQRAEAIEFRCLWLGRRATGSLAALRQVAQTARREGAAWVHVHGLPSEPVGLVLTLALRLALNRPGRGSGTAIAVTPHNAFGRRGPHEFRRMRRFTLRRFDRVFVFHDDHRRWAGPRATRAPFVHPGPDQMLDLRGPHPPHEPARRPGGDRKIVCLPGQIRADKGFHLVPAALAGQDYAIQIAGTDNGGYAKLRAAAQRHGVPLLGQPGFADERDFLTTIAESDVVLLPYTRVTQSGVLAYARATGTPVAGSAALRDAGLPAEAYFDLDDRDSMRAAVEEAIRTGHTPTPAVDGTRQTGPTIGLYGDDDPLAELVADLRESSGVFVVGSPRSGTTVAARWLADRLGADLPPETHYFTKLRPLLSQSSSRDDLHDHVRLLDTYAEATESDTQAVADAWWHDGGPRSLGHYLSGRGDPWVEKTPGHLRHWPQLLRFDGRAKVLAVTRAVPATLVSQTEVGWLADRDPRQLLARILADRLHLGLLRLVAPRRFRVLRYEDLVAAAEALPESAAAVLPHESWKTLSGQADLVEDRNRAARARRPAIWRVGASPALLILAVPGAGARVLVDLARSLHGLRAARR